MPATRTGVIDAHVHLYPAEVAKDPALWAERMGEPAWGALVTPHPERRVRQGWANCDRLLRDMDAAGVERAILLGWYWERLETCQWHNRYYESCVRAHPDRLSAFATVNAAAEADALAEMRRCADAGFIGLGEICPRAFGVSPLHPQWVAVFQLAIELNWPVNLHVTDPSSRVFPGRIETPLDEIVALAEQMPRLRLILAHWGGGLALHELNPRCRKALANAAYDTAATPLLYDARVYAAASNIVGADRILFGSDYPLLVFPKDQAEPDLTRVVQAARASGLPLDQMNAVLGGNAARMLRR
jgi:predicted TIM-barrel fold metal-dependent hydrolase